MSLKQCLGYNMESSFLALQRTDYQSYHWGYWLEKDSTRLVILQVNISRTCQASPCLGWNGTKSIETF